MVARYKQIKMQGSHTPTPIIFVHGFINGRVKSAGIDQDTNALNSSYVNAKLNVFYKFAKEKVGRLQQETSAICQEAEQLLFELRNLRKDAIKLDLEKSYIDSQRLRQLARIKKRKEEIQKRLVQIHTCILLKEDKCRNDIDIAANKIKAQFFTYAHGVTLRPVNSLQIPEVNYDWNQKNEKTLELIENALEKEENNYA